MVNADFNFESFTISAIKSIDEIRSNGLNASIDPVESRINAFYRALGLPAIRSKNSPLDALNSGNLFEVSAFSSTEDGQSRILGRLAIRELNFIKPLTEQEIQSFTENLSSIKENLGVDTLSRIESNTQSKNEEKKRLRGTMLPMIVNGDIPIFPQTKRVAGAFKLEEELTVGRNKYKRPLIEIIITIRLKGQGAENSNKQGSVSEDLTSSGEFNFSKVNENLLDTLFASLNSITIDKARQEVETVRMVYGNTIKVIPTADNIIEQKPEVQIVTDTNNIHEEALRKVFQQQKEDLKRSLLSIFEYDDTSQTTLNQGVSFKRNLKESMLEPVLLNIVNPQDENAEREVKEYEEKEDKFKEKMIASFRSLDAVLGKFSGISGTDMLIIMLALFLIDIRYLVGLLNDEGKERLLAFGLGGADLLGASLRESISELESKVEELYNTVDKMIKSSAAESTDQERV